MGPTRLPILEMICLEPRLRFLFHFTMPHRGARLPFARQAAPRFRGDADAPGPSRWMPSCGDIRRSVLQIGFDASVDRSFLARYPLADTLSGHGFYSWVLSSWVWGSFLNPLEGSFLNPL